MLTTTKSPLALAAAHGYEDGECIPLDLVTTVVARIAAAVDLPVSVDVEVVESTEELIARELDIYSPNALGHALTPEVAESLRCVAVCGAANNQLATPEVAEMLAGRGILYAPDYLVNCGGAVQAAEELPGFDMDRAKARVAGVYAPTLRVLGRSDAEGVRPAIAAPRVVWACGWHGSVVLSAVLHVSHWARHQWRVCTST